MAEKNIIIYGPLSLWHIHFATDLELAQIALSSGANVHWIHCCADLQVCQSNPKGLKSRCKSCAHCFNLGMNWLQHARLTILNLNNLDSEQKESINSFTQDIPTTLEELKAITIENSDIGFGVLSSLISLLREPCPDLLKHKDYIKKSIYSALLVHYSLTNYISSIKPDKLYLFNGRYAELRPALRICQQKGVSVFTHDRAGVQGKYKLTPNNYPHSLEYIKSDIVNHWLHNTHTEKQRIKISRTWFNERIVGKDQAWFSFVKKQKKGQLPKRFDFNKNNVGIFVSSEDEFVAIVEWKNNLYRNQNDGIIKILEEYNSNPSNKFSFYIRIHPNLTGLDNTQIRGLLEIANRYDIVTVIPPESKVDTYALVKAVDIVLTFGTTVGIEAANLGTPSILIGRSFYEDLDVVIKPDSHKELITFLNKFDSKNFHTHYPVSKRGLAMYGYYQATAGRPYLYVSQKSVNQFRMVRNGAAYSITLNRYRRIIRYFLGLLGR